MADDESQASESNRNTQTLINRYEDPYSNPLYLATSDNSFLPVIGFKLNDDNYLLWSESMEVALRTKNKWGFINGTVQVPPITDPSYSTWDRCNGTVLCWIRNSVSEDIVPSLRNIRSAAEAWAYLRSKFSQGDSVRIANLQEKVDLTKQGNQTVRQYHTNLKVLWDEQASYEPIPICECAAKTHETVIMYQDRRKVIRFLLGLNETYQQAKTQMLMLDPLPDIDTVYRAVIQLERQMNTGKGKSTQDSIALAAATGNLNQRREDKRDAGREGKKGQELFCRYCKKDNHVIEDCYRLKNKRKLEGGNRNFAGSVEVNSGDGNNSAGSNTQSPTSPVSENRNSQEGQSIWFTSDEISKLRNLLQHQSATPQFAQSNSVTTRSSAPVPPRHSITGKVCLSTTLENHISAVWVLDTGASDHIVCNVNLMLRCKEVSDMYVTLPNGQSAKVSHIGIAKIPCGILITNVLLVPSFTYNLISVSQLTKKTPVSLLFESNFCCIQDLISQQKIGSIQVDRGLYLLGSGAGGNQRNKHQAYGVNTNHESDLWHLRLGHLSLPRLQTIQKQNSSITFPSSSHCEICNLSKQKRLPFPRSNSVCKEPFDMIHVDIWGPVNVVSHDGFKYFMTVVDDHSRSTWLFLMSSKSEARGFLQSFCAMVQTQFDKTIRVVRSDQGQEFNMPDFYNQHGMIHQLSCVRTAQQNGRVERKHQHLLNVARSLKIQSGMPVSFWSHFVLHAAYLINRIPTPILSNKSPFECLYGIPPDYSNLKVFGCMAYATDLNEHKGKLDPRAKRAAFLGYPYNIKGYRLFDLETLQVFDSRDVVFNESCFPFKLSQQTSPNPSTQTSSSIPTPNDFYEEPSTLPILPTDHNVHETVDPDYDPSYASDSDNSDETPLPSPIPTSPDPSPPLPQPASTLDVPIALRKATRETKRPSHLSDYHVSLLTHSTPEHDTTLLYPLSQSVSYDHLSPSHKHFSLSISVVPEPQSYSQAIKDPRWERAIIEELRALIDNQTWVIVELPSGHTAVGCKWLFKTKYLADGTVDRFKARLVAKGYTQIPGIDFVDTYSPVAKMNSVKLLLAVAAIKGRYLHQLDVSNAFLHGDLEEDVYMELPEGMKDQPGMKGKVLKLQKSLYGLKQASRQWYIKLSACLQNLGFELSFDDYSVFKLHSKGATVIVIIYVDDIIVAGDDLDLIQQTKQQLQQAFKVKDLGNLKYFLGIEIARSAAGISLCQRKFCLELLSESGFLESKPAKTPLSMKTTLSASDGIPLTDGTEYRHLLGQLQYLTTTRPDICFPVQQLCQFQGAPTTVHLSALHRVLRYLKSCPAQGLWFSSSSSTLIRGYCDSDWATCPDSRRSVTGYCTFLGDSLVTWKSKKQTTVSRSSSEAEYRALAQLSCEVQWLKSLLHFFGQEHPDPIKVFCDNSSAIHIAENPIFHERTKHIEVDCHVTRERLKSGLLTLHHIRTDNQLADFFTKGLSTDRFASLLCKLGVHDMYSAA
ncbi:unnamed protein product [Linum trigynum]|uniref:Integrase catalytic domain-containing protein n=1 Tax=Linum trigynum TaxID=586398 RepID=A0AAV2G510_9ROSI